MTNFAFLIDASRTPMNPIHPAQARSLLEAGKAAIFRKYPFTLILKRVVGNIVTYPLSLRIDPGSKTTGISLINNRNEVVWGMELTHRGQAIKHDLEVRKAARHGRRARKTRYRQPRFLNRTRPKGWLAPSLRHRVLTILTWVKRLLKYAPVTEIRQELVRFDLQQLENPEISGIEYQQGELQGYEVREYLLEKWARKCAYCSVENVPLEVEHIQARSKGGSDRISNLTLACHSCNQSKGNQNIKDFLSSKPDVLKRVLAQAKAPLNDAAAVNSTRWKLLETLKLTGLPVTTGSGGLTKFNRTRLGFPKTHWLDAACVGHVDNLKLLVTCPLIAKATGYGTRRLCRMDKFGFPCSKPRKHHDTPWRTGDIAKSPAGILGRVVVQTAKLIEIRVNGTRHRCKPLEAKPVHRKDGYSYA